MSGIAHQRRNVGLLFLCQSLNQAAMSGQVAMSALIGHSLAGDKALATLPMAVQMAATMAASIPASWMFARLGRRIGFSAGVGVFLITALDRGTSPAWAGIRVTRPTATGEPLPPPPPEFH